MGSAWTNAVPNSDSSPTARAGQSSAREVPITRTPRYMERSVVHAGTFRHEREPSRVSRGVPRKERRLPSVSRCRSPSESPRRLVKFTHME